ncbi:hypothetical protein [Haliangium sp.]|uniref:hypothetical protein n=1 Tax=Haliangium sp. TaxID=2663208 RepID=UPI003D0E494C
MMDLYPLTGVDPIILRDPPEARLDHALPGGTRPPMGFAVARLLARQIAYDYCEHDEHPIAAWIFAHLNDAGPPSDARPPGWLTAPLSMGFSALRPDAMLAFCERALEDLDRRWAVAVR